MEYVQILISLLKIITYFAAAEFEMPVCQVTRQQQIRRGHTHQFYRGPKPDHIYRGTGSAYCNGTTGSYMTCAGMCMWDDACKSFNFCKDGKRCELNAAVYSKNLSDLIYSIGCQYFDEAYHEPEADAKIESHVECLTPGPLGLEDGSIPDDLFSASSEYDGANFYRASYARLNREYGWAPDNNQNSWIEVDLGGSMTVSGVVTQGGGRGWFVTQYKVLYGKPPSSSASEYVTDDNGDVKTFVGNVADNTPVTNMFDQSIVATAIRIEPVTWRTGVAMRLELLGCRN